MIVEVMDIHAVNDATFGENKAYIFTSQRLQRSRVLNDEH
jgi:hypothetical protein